MFVPYWAEPSMPQKFGSQHTEDKLDKLAAYLGTFTTALKKQQFKLVYFDAFAGTPERDLGEDAPLLQTGDVTRFLQGSTKRALSIAQKFDRYVFVERKKSNVQELEALKTEFPLVADRIDIRCGDANAEIEAFCENWPRNQRAVVFLDPFGNQVAWRTMEALAATRYVDVWYLFPAGLGVHRQISRSGSHDGREETLDRLLGATDWREKFIESVKSDDLFGAATTRKKVLRRNPSRYT
jgi:three-Cys-motif partner protein